MDKADVSLILPVYNEAELLESSAKELARVLDESKKDYEIIIAQDPSTDGTGEIAERLQKKYRRIRHLRFAKRLGRGKSVSEAIKAARGSIVGFVDADLETPASQIIPVMDAIQSGYDMAIGVRYFRMTAGSIARWVTSNAYSYLVKRILRIPVSDTETGCKFFNKKKILPVLNKMEDNHWFWDTEIVFWAYYSGLKIKEVPTIFVRKRIDGSKVNIFRDSLGYFFKLIRFRIKHNSIVTGNGV